jgi:transcriptional regulator with XRE-family HTH domain
MTVIDSQPIRASSDADIAHRLQVVRLISDKSQQNIAELLKIKRPRWATYEANRAPIKADLAMKYCALLDVNEIWLATGRGVFRGSVISNSTDLIEQIVPGQKFRDYYESVLSKNLPRSAILLDELTFASLDSFKNPEDIKEFVHMLIDHCLRSIPDNQLVDLTRTLWTAVTKFRIKQAAVTPRIHAKSKR